MHPTVLFFVLLFLPGTSLRNWEQSNTPTLHRLIQTGAIALMNARTAERDTITTAGGERTIFAGARLYADDKEGILNYPAQPDNLIFGLQKAGIAVVLDNPSRPAPAPEKGQRQFRTAELSGDWRGIDREIAAYSKLVSQSGGRLIIVSPNPTACDFRAQRQLTPILLWGNSVEHGFLVSPSTNEAGLVANTDIAETIAGAMGATLPTASYGEALYVAPRSSGSVVDLWTRENRWVGQSTAMKTLPYIAAGLAVLILTAILFDRTRRSIAVKVAAFAASVPLLLSLSSSIPALLIICWAALLILVRIKSASNYISAISALTVLLIMLAALIPGGGPAAGSMLGYSPIEGARFYGIGNEEMGACIGALVVLTALLNTKLAGRSIATAVWMIVGLCLSMPWAGAKAGALIVCFVSITAYWLAGNGKSLTLLSSSMILAASVVLSVIMLVISSHFGPRTHVTQTLSMVKSSGHGVILQTILRKAGMDLHLVFHSVWVWVLALTSYSRWQMRGRNTLFAFGTAAVIACLIFNDAGVVAAALCSLIIWGADFGGHQKKTKVRAQAV